MKKLIHVLVLLVISSLIIEAEEVETFNIYKSDLTVMRFVVDSVSNIQMDESTNLLTVYRNDSSVYSVNLANVDSMDYSKGEYTLPTVKLTSCTYDSDEGRIDCVVNRTDDGADDNIQDQGICWSTTGTPTINDNIVSAKYSSSKFYSLIDDLTRGKNYHIRAYAVNCMGVSYSDDVEVVKTASGNVTYNLDVDEDYEYYDLLVTALDSACYYYNLYTTFDACIYVYQNDGIPTAQASYHGSVGFGASTSYMWVGTTMHEFAHYFGSGTTTAWQSLMVDNVWQGENGQAVCQEVYGEELCGDSQHFWPGGINYSSEVSSATDLINHCKIVEAMVVEDAGLPESW